MSFVEDIRINGQLYESIPPVIAGLNPSFTWEFIPDVASSSQSAFEIRVGTSDSNCGNNNFDGNILTYYTINTSNFYDFTQHNLSRGHIYYGQIKILDQKSEFTTWTQFAFQTNLLPFATDFSLSPISPTSFEDIELSYTYHDIDKHEESGTKIRWYKNNILQSAYNDICVLPSLATLPDESWLAKITVSDGLEYGTTVITQSVTITESEIVFNSIKILPENANVDDLLKVEYSISNNEYIGTSEIVLISWYVNNKLIQEDTSGYARLNLSPGDIVYVILTVNNSNNVLSTKQSLDKEIQDVPWHIYNLEIDGLRNPINLTNLNPYLEWKTHKTTSIKNQEPTYLKILVTKTKSLSSPIYDTGFIPYLKNSYSIPSNIIERGRNYFIHIGASDTTDIDDVIFESKEIRLSGSSWAENVSNSKGWTIEFKAQIDPTGNSSNLDPKLGLYINDGTYFCSIICGLRYIKLISDQEIIYQYSSDLPDLTSLKTFKISAKNQSIKMLLDNKLIITSDDLLTNKSNLKSIEYGDIDSQNENEVIFKFLRYSTNGAYGLDDSLTNQNEFLFSTIGSIQGGSIEYSFNNLISWLPDDEKESAKLIYFNENSQDILFPTVTTSYSPITSIQITENRNKYIGTANGVTVIFGDKHDPDYIFTTASLINNTIVSKDFDRISNITSDQLELVEAKRKSKWFSINTTYRTVLVQGSADPYDPYSPISASSSVVHYYSQRVPGHAWFDNVNNSKGWRVSFSFNLENLEADTFVDVGLEKKGFGVYINDGTKQEILYFYEDRIRLFYANVFVLINTKIERDYVITGKDNNIFIYQRIRSSNSTSYFTLVDGSGLFITESSKTCNSRKPKIILDNYGIYHSVWHDDSNKKSQIFYSTLNGSIWSTPEIVTQSAQFSLKNPTIDFDSVGRIWIAYEDLSWGVSEISVSVKDSIGWNPKTRITSYKSSKYNPFIKIDDENNVHLVWEDNRDGPYKIFWAEFINSKKAWMSSAQFDEDTPVMQIIDNDPYQSIDPYLSTSTDFKKPQLCLFDNKLWLICEGHLQHDETSVIYYGSRDLVNNFWNTLGASIKNSSGDVIGFGTSQIINNSGRNCINPTVSSSENQNILLVVWEDTTDSINQIWGAAFNRNGIKTLATQITNQTTSCNNPSCGWNINYGTIVFNKNRSIYSCYYDPSTFLFYGSNTSGYDTFINIDDNKNVSNPNITPFSPSTSTRIVYDFVSDRDPLQISTIEFAEFQVIGSALLEQDLSVAISTVATVLDETISSLDSKEFAFGDFSENSGIIANWKDITMYFGYDSKPYSISKYNTNTVSGWPDNRINDMFVDVFGNIVAATFGGLVYYNIFTGELTKIDGRTSTFSSSAGCTNETCLLNKKLTTAVKWGKNGIWYVGTTQGIYFSRSAGRTWEALFSDTLSSKIINSITVNKDGQAIIAAYDLNSSTGSGIYIAHPDMLSVIYISTPNPQITCVAIDDNNIIWCGSSNGLFRIENYVNIITFDRNSGMRSSYVNDIVIVNKYLRFIATATGVERMNGIKFVNFNVKNKSLINDNISSLFWFEKTKSLWIGNLYVLTEIVFRDDEYEIIGDEIIHYDNSEISTENIYDRNIYHILDFNSIQSDPNDPISLSTSNAKVFINKNPINFGYTIDTNGQSILFATNLLINDQIEIELSNRFINKYDFNQSNIEKTIVGEKRTNILKFDLTSKNQLLLLSGLDKPSLLLDGGVSSLPFTTIMIDRDPPIGCIEKLDVLTRSIVKFRILAFDSLSGIDGMVLSNYENFTSDGSTLLDFVPFKNIVNHDVGSDLTNIIVSLSIPETAVIGVNTISVGSGSKITTWFDQSTNTNYLYIGTNKPAVIFKYTPSTEEWIPIQPLNGLDLNQTINNLLTINNIIWITTGSISTNGSIYKSVDGINFQVVGGISGSDARGIALGPDGTIYFGSSDGTVYSYKNNILSIKYQNIGQSIYDLSIIADTLLVSTGNSGRIYSINLITNDSIIVFDGTESHISTIYVKDSGVVSSVDQSILFAGSGDFTSIYKSNLSDFSFTRSYASFGKTIHKIGSVDSVALVDPSNSQGISGTNVIASIGDSLYKFNGISWEFFYKHTEDILDFIQYFYAGITGIWIISNTKVTKWTSVVNSKTVFLKLKDKAGNISSSPIFGDTYTCPTDTRTLCCDFAYSINISDLQGFINESRILNISEYGEILFTYDSDNNRQFFGADKISTEIGIYTSEIFNGSNDLVSWKSITWDSSEPEGTSISFQIRYGLSEDEVLTSDWSENLIKNSQEFVSIDHITNQYLQFRSILSSQVRDLSPSLTSVTLRNITAQSSHFFTTNFILPSRPIKGLLTTNTFIPISADIIFGINTKNSIDFGDYQIIEPNRLFSISQKQFGSNLRIGAKLLSPGIPQIMPTPYSGDPYDASSFQCNILFDFENIGAVGRYHFRVRFYNDPLRTQLIYTFFTGNDQTGWKINNENNNIFPSNGVLLSVSEIISMTFNPLDSIDNNQKWYLTIESYDGSNFETILNDKSYICSDCHITNESGLLADYYSGFSEITSLPQFSSLTPQFSTIDLSINFPYTLTAWITSDGTNLGSGFINKFAARWRGKISLPTSGEYKFTLNSDDGSMLFIDNSVVIDFNGLHDETIETGFVTLNVGFHDIEVQYFASFGPSGIQLEWTLPGETTSSIVPANRLFHAVANEYCEQTNVPKIYNLALIFEMENGEKIKLNLD